jgi:hypothetical protein
MLFFNFLYRHREYVKANTITQKQILNKLKL